MDEQISGWVRLGRLSRLIFEAKGPQEYLSLLYRYVEFRYGTNELENLKSQVVRFSNVGPNGPQQFARYATQRYADPKIDKLIELMTAALGKVQADQGIEQDNVFNGIKGTIPKNPPKEYPKLSPDEIAQKNSAIDAIRQFRKDAGKARVQQPKDRIPGHDLRQIPLKPQNHGFEEGGEWENPDDIQVSQSAPGKSGVISAQQKVDAIYKSHGPAIANILARRLGVPTTDDRTVEDQYGRTKVQIWNYDKIMKYMDRDLNPNAPEPGKSKKIEPEPDGPITRGDITHYPRKDDSGGRKNRGPINRPGFEGERVKIPGLAQKKPAQRADYATGNFQRFSREVSPQENGTEYVFRKGQWVKQEDPRLRAKREKMMAKLATKKKSAGSALSGKPLTQDTGTSHQQGKIEPRTQSSKTARDFLRDVIDHIDAVHGDDVVEDFRKVMRDAKSNGGAEYVRRWANQNHGDDKDLAAGIERMITAAGMKNTPRGDYYSDMEAERKSREDLAREKVRADHMASLEKGREELAQSKANLDLKAKQGKEREEKYKRDTDEMAAQRNSKLNTEDEYRKLFRDVKYAVMGLRYSLLSDQPKDSPVRKEIEGFDFAELKDFITKNHSQDPDLLIKIKNIEDTLKDIRNFDWDGKQSAELTKLRQKKSNP